MVLLASLVLHQHYQGDSCFSWILKEDFEDLYSGNEVIFHWERKMPRGLALMSQLEGKMDGSAMILQQANVSAFTLADGN